jgi:autotransporter-associated beta strand protein
MNNVANWSTVSGASTPDPSSIGTTDTLRFNEFFAPTSGTNYTADLTANLSVGAIRLDSGSGNGGSATGNVVVSGNNTLTLNGNNDYNGSYLSGIVLNSGSGGSLTINSNITLGSSQHWVSSRAFTVGGSVNLNGNNLTIFSAGNTTTLNGGITGSGNLSKIGNGAWSLSNISFTGNINHSSGSGNLFLTGNNTFTGKVTVTDTASRFIILNSTSALGSANAIELAASSTADIILGEALAGNSVTIGSLSGGTSGATIDPNWNATTGVRSLVINQSIDGTYGGATQAGSSGRSIAITKDGAAKLTLTGANAHTGGTTVSDGVLEVGNGGTSGSVGSGAISVATGAEIVFNRSNAFTVSNTISGAGLVTKKGAGRMTVNGDNSVGTVNWNFADTGNGDIGFQNANAIGGSGSSITLGENASGSAFLATTGNTSDVTISLGSGSTFSWNGSTGNTNTLSGTISGSGNLTKVSGETLILSGNNSYAGATAIETGTLRIDGIHTGTGDVNVDSDGRLEGTGSVAGTINVSGVLAPGASIESFGSGAVAFMTGSTLAYELNSSSLNGDLLDSTGVLDIASGAILTLTELASGTLAEGSKLALISYAGGWVNTELFTYLGSPLADDSSFTLGANTWLFNYNDTTGGSNFSSDQAGASAFVTMTVIPEHDAALLGGIGMLLLLRRRR